VHTHASADYLERFRHTQMALAPTNIETAATSIAVDTSQPAGSPTAE
jgi:hypothetical protein